MKNSNYIDYEQMSTEMMNSKYNNIGISKKQKNFFTKRKIIFIIFSLSFIILILYLIFRPSKKKSPENINPEENKNLNDIDKELELLLKKEEELKNENNKLKEKKDSLQKENDDLDKQIKEFNDKNNKIDIEKEITEKKEKIKDYEKKVKELKEKIEKLNEKGKELKDKKEENDKEIIALETKIDDLEKELNVEKKEENKNNNEDEKKEDKNKDKEEEKEDKKTDQIEPLNPELVSRIKSKIILEYKHLELLDKWFGKKLKYNLLYRASEENYSSEIFHKKVDKNKNTIIFIKDINNFIYGGFTTKTWDGNKQYKTDEKSILFNLDKQQYYEVNDSSHAIFCDKELLVVFGEGDLILGPKSIESAFPKSYGNKNIKDNELTMGLNKLSPVEIEVFQLS